MQMQGTDATLNIFVLPYDDAIGSRCNSRFLPYRRGARKDKMVSGRLFGSTVAPTDEDAAGGSGSNVGGAAFGNSMFCKDSRGGHRDESSTASFQGRGRMRLGASAVCFSCLRQKYVSTSIQRESRIPAVIDRDVAVCSL